MKITQSPVIETPAGFEQTILYPHAGRTRTEVFCGRTPDELQRMVNERRAELKNTSSNIRRRA
jgi:hypothetical protein